MNEVLETVDGKVIDPKIPHYENTGAITTKPAQTVNMESTSVPTKIKLGSETINTNPNLFEISDDGGVRVLQDGVYEVSGQIYFGRNNQSNDYLGAFIYQNDKQIQYCGVGCTQGYVSVAIAPMISNAKANDIYSLEGMNTTRTGGELSSNNLRSYFTVKKIA